MPKLDWIPEQKTAEWDFAKSQLIVEGQLKPPGTKLRRKSHSDKLTHSFLVVLLANGEPTLVAFDRRRSYLGAGIEGRVKLVEDEAGHCYAVKIMSLTLTHRGADIELDLGRAGPVIVRSNKSYLVMPYLGVTLANYVANNTPSLDECYRLGIQMALALFALHQGLQTISGKGYFHGDLSAHNVTIDDSGVHLIDFSKYPNRSDTSFDIAGLLYLLYVPAADHKLYKSGLFNGWLMETNNPKMFELLASSGHMKKLIQRQLPSLVDIAETLTLCRFDLEPPAEIVSQEERLDRVYQLNGFTRPSRPKPLPEPSFESSSSTPAFFQPTSPEGMRDSAKKEVLETSLSHY